MYLKLGKVASVGMQALVMQVDDIGGHDVQEVAVMAYHNQCLLPPLQVLLDDHQIGTRKGGQEGASV